MSGRAWTRPWFWPSCGWPPAGSAFTAAIPPVMADPRRMVQLLLNLLFNAMESIRDRGTVTVEILGADGKARIVVEDTGVGMDTETLERVGEPFFTTRPGGTGLGIAIARQIVDEHGAEIRFESVQGRGTRVILDIPGCQEERSHASAS